MSDDRIIDFNDLKNKVKDSDVDKFEQYIYNLYFSVMDGSMTMAEFSRKIYDYMRENNISQEKFMNIQSTVKDNWNENYWDEFVQLMRAIIIYSFKKNKLRL